MAAGCPVVASKVGGLAEVIDHEETGLTVMPDNPNSIAWAVDHLISHPEQAPATRACRQAEGCSLLSLGSDFRFDTAVYDTALTNYHGQEA